MATETKTKEELEKKAQRIHACYNAMAIDFLQFGDHANRAIALPYKGYIDGAEKFLGQIEEAIRRYRKELPQSFEEQPED